MATDSPYEYDATPEQMQQHSAKLRQLIAKRRKRWYIQFNLKGPRDPSTGKWQKAVLPILFRSYDEAFEYTRSVPIFKNLYGVARSLTIEKTMVAR